MSNDGACLALSLILGLILSLVPGPLSVPQAVAQSDTQPVVQPTTPSIGTQLAGDSKAAQLIVVVGAEGTAQYGQEFQQAAAKWQLLAQAQQWQLTQIGGANSSAGTPEHDEVESSSDREHLKLALASAAQNPPHQLWVVFIGHGTSERGIHKFNLVGPDVSSKELAGWLQPIPCPLIFIDCTSASAPFLPELSKPGRVIITATKSGTENNYSRFGTLLADSLLDPTTDIDHDDEVSLLEAFLAASLKTEKLYKELSRLATEHAILDDNGDKLGTGAEFFRGVRTVKSAAGGKQPDGAVAAKIVLSVLPGGPQLSPAQLEQRAEIESRIEALRRSKPNPATDQYWNSLETLLLELAQLYRQAEGT